MHDNNSPALEIEKCILVQPFVDPSDVGDVMFATNRRHMEEGVGDVCPIGVHRCFGAVGSLVAGTESLPSCQPSTGQMAG